MTTNARFLELRPVGAVLLIPSLLSALPCEAFQSHVFRSTSTRRCSSTRYIGDPAKDTTPENHTTGGTSSSNNNGGWAVGASANPKPSGASTAGVISSARLSTILAMAASLPLANSKIHAMAVAQHREGAVVTSQTVPIQAGPESGGGGCGSGGSCIPILAAVPPRMPRLKWCDLDTGVGGRRRRRTRQTKHAMRRRTTKMPQPGHC